MKSYHGTDKISASNIFAGKVSISDGSGELGQGFYTGNLLYVAKAWAWNRHSRSDSVVQFVTDKKHIKGLNLAVFDYQQAFTIVLQKNTRCRFNVDMVIAPIVGGTATIYAYLQYLKNGNHFFPWVLSAWDPKLTKKQYKWESVKSEALLNSSNTTRTHV